MKQRFIVLSAIVLLFIITGCNKKNKITFDIDNYGSYTGFDNVKRYLSAEKAVEDGCYVNEDGSFSGTEYWEAFLETAAHGKDAKLRMIILLKENEDEYIDLFYHDGLYYAFKSAAGDLTAKGYKYLLSLDDKKIINNTVLYAVVLSNDSTLTFSKIINDALSCERIMTDEIYKFVYFGMRTVLM